MMLSISLLIKERRFPYDDKQKCLYLSSDYIYCPECKARIELNKVKILVDKQQNDASNVNNH